MKLSYLLAVLALLPSKAYAEVCDKYCTFGCVWEPQDGPITQFGQLLEIFARPSFWIFALIWLIGIKLRSKKTAVIVTAFAGFGVFAGIFDWISMHDVLKHAVREGCRTVPISSSLLLSFIALSALFTSFWKKSLGVKHKRQK